MKAKLIYNGYTMEFKDIPVGTIFSWGNRVAWYIKCSKRKAIRLDHGEKFDYYEYGAFDKYIEAKEIVIR